MRIGRVAIVAAVVLLAACGGGDGDRLTADDFRQQANAICAEYEGRLDEVETPSSPEDLQRFVDETVPILEEGTAELEELRPPEELEDDWNRVMELNREQLDTVRELRTAAQEADVARVGELLQQGEEASRESDRLAAGLGLDRCGSD